MKGQKENGKKAGKGPGRKSIIPKIEELPTPDGNDKLAEPTGDLEMVGASVSEEHPVPTECSTTETLAVIDCASSEQNATQLSQGVANLECGQATQEAARLDGQPTCEAASLDGQPIQEAASLETAQEVKCGQSSQDEVKMECGQPIQEAASAECAQEQ